MNELQKAMKEYEQTAKSLANFLVSGRLKIGAALREERQRKGISLRALGKKLGVSAAFLSDVELGHRNLSMRLYDKISKL